MTAALTWQRGAWPKGYGPGSEPEVTCSDASHCAMLGFVEHDGIAGGIMRSAGTRRGRYAGAVHRDRVLRRRRADLDRTSSVPAARCPYPMIDALTCPTATTCYAAGSDAHPAAHRQHVATRGPSVVAVTRRRRPDLAAGHLRGPGARYRAACRATRSWTSARSSARRRTRASRSGVSDQGSTVHPHLHEPRLTGGRCGPRRIRAIPAGEAEGVLPDRVLTTCFRLTRGRARPAAARGQPAPPGSRPGQAPPWDHRAR